MQKGYFLELLRCLCMLWELLELLRMGISIGNEVKNNDRFKKLISASFILVCQSVHIHYLIKNTETRKIRQTFDVAFYV